MTLLAVERLTTAFATETRQVTAIEDISFSVERGEILGIVGESGSGKSVTALAIMDHVADAAGAASWEGMYSCFDGKDLLSLPDRAMQRLRNPGIAMVFQGSR